MTHINSTVGFLWVSLVWTNQAGRYSGFQEETVILKSPHTYSVLMQNNGSDSALVKSSASAERIPSAGRRRRVGGDHSCCRCAVGRLLHCMADVNNAQDRKTKETGPVRTWRITSTDSQLCNNSSVKLPPGLLVPEQSGFVSGLLTVGLYRQCRAWIHSYHLKSTTKQSEILKQSFSSSWNRHVICFCPGQLLCSDTLP